MKKVERGRLFILIVGFYFNLLHLSFGSGARRVTYGFKKQVQFEGKNEKTVELLLIMQ